MNKNEVIEALHSGGAKRKKALAFIFKDKELKRSIKFVLSPYAITLKNFFPHSETSDGTRKNKNYIDHFFVEAVFILDKKIRQNELTAKSYSQLKSFIVTTCKTKCIEFLRKKNAESNFDDSSKEKYTNRNEYLEKERNKVLHKILSKIGKNCKELLLMFYSGFSMIEIAEKMKFKSKDVAKQSKARCMKNLIDFCESNADVNEFLNPKN